jgi:glutathione S-transferase
MLELYQFELSHYCEKVRLILDYKGLDYRKIEVTPGIGQIDVMRISGQRQVPVLKDGNEIIADSTAIAKYLEQRYPEKPILPHDPKQRGLCLLMEEWADQSLGVYSSTLLLHAVSRDGTLRAAMMPASVPEPIKYLVGAVPGDLFKFLGNGMGVIPDLVKTAQDAIRQDLEALCYMLLGANEHTYLAGGDHPTLADLAVAGLSMYLKFPEGGYLNAPSALLGRGVPGFAEVGTFSPFFEWRDRLYTQCRKPLGGGSSFSGNSDRLTSIQID